MIVDQSQVEVKIIVGDKYKDALPLPPTDLLYRLILEG
jgi:hypothetical protein